MTIPRRLNTIFRIGLFALYFSFLPTAYSADAANNPAVISGVNSASVTEDVDPDGDNLMEASGKLNITGKDAGEAAFIAVTHKGTYGNLHIQATGQWNYAASKYQSVIQVLGAGDKLTDTIKVSSIDGTTHSVVISINGANDAARISGVYSGSVTEDVDPDGDNLLEVGRKLNIVDKDAGEAAFKAGTHKGTYGDLSIQATGQWNYAARNNQAVIQALGAGDKLTDTIKVSSIDGTTHSVIISIKGANDVAGISGVSSGSVTEDVDPDGDNLMEASGKLNITGKDAGEAAFIAVTHKGTYGNLHIQATGQWNYAASKYQSVIQVLGAGDKLTDTIKVSSIDGTTHSVVISINGANDAARISGVYSGSVTEDVDPDGDNLLEVGRKLNIVDKDAGEAAFKAGTHKGTYGDLSIQATGQWNYAARNNQAVIQALGAGDKLTDTIKVSSIDGTTHSVIISIKGANDVAGISGVSSGSVTEDVDPDGDNLMEASGKLNITGKDAGEAAFIAVTYKGTYGNLHIQATGQWNYAASKYQSVIQVLGAGDKLTDTIKVSSIDGTTHSVVISINGANDAARISGVYSGSVTEDVDPDGDNLLEVGRKLNIVDKDAGEAAFKAGTHKGTYGDLSIQATGQWNYAARNNQAVIQALGAGDKLTDTIKVSSIDGTTHSVIISIKGANDVAGISGVSSGSVTEDVDPDGDNLMEASGKLNITGKDAGEAAFIAVTHKGTYGNLHIQATGQWNYAASKYQSVIQVLGAGDKLTDTIKVSSIDGTTHSVVISINGANDAARISGVYSGSVTEDVDPDGDNLLEVGRKLNIVDKDAGEAAFKAGTHKGTYGDLSIQATGQWNYAARNNQAVIQALGAGDKLTDTIKVSSIDGTTRSVIISIKGANDAASISDVNSGGANGSGDITMSWIAPVEREDGTAISMSEIAGYRVYYGISQGDYTREVEINNSSTMNVRLSNLKSGTYYIVVTSVDWDGRESAFSQEVSKSI